MAPAAIDVRAAVSTIEFYKMTGSGNDFVVLDGTTLAEPWSAARIREICDRRNGVGADGFVVLTPGSTGAVRMDFWNSDGSRAALCGNAALCSAHLAVALGLVSAGEHCLLTDAGPIRARASLEGSLPAIKLPDVPLSSIRDMGELCAPGEHWVTLLTVGVPHLVVGMDDLSNLDISLRGAFLRSHPALGPAGANVNFVAPSGRLDQSWTIRTFERGVEGETLACGTGTVASALTLAQRRLGELPLMFQSRGGLQLAVEGVLDSDAINEVWLRGEGRLVFRGLWETRK